jgi:hypothetical protein
MPGFGLCPAAAAGLGDIEEFVDLPAKTLVQGSVMIDSGCGVSRLRRLANPCYYFVLTVLQTNSSYD